MDGVRRLYWPREFIAVSISRGKPCSDPFASLWLYNAEREQGGQKSFIKSLHLGDS